MGAYDVIRGDPGHAYRTAVPKSRIWDQPESAVFSSFGVGSNRFLVGWPRSDINLMKGRLEKTLAINPLTGVLSLSQWVPPTLHSRVLLFLPLTDASSPTLHWPSLNLPSIKLFLSLTNVKPHYLFVCLAQFFTQWNKKLDLISGRSPQHPQKHDNSSTCPSFL